jgi:prepilin-type N-terminal cleavage/methylation domain-containing protein
VRPTGQRGFTLLETIVAVGIVAMLAGVVFWSFAIRPAAASQAADDFDASFAAARAIAQAQPNGATLAFLPRSGGRDGFLLRVYAGRPNGQGDVTADNVMPIDASASVTEASLGKPPFALFLGASDHVSGRARYPRIDGAHVSFETIPDEPPCPQNGFTLRFFSPGRSALTRHITCTVWIATAPLPNPSPTPNTPNVQPTALVYHWPADRTQQFAASEWGYTHWFATTDGFRCGDGVATFPNVLPSPYSPPYDEQEGLASPPPPPNTPYSYPNAHGQSMNDAPAPFPLEPLSAGLCRAEVADDYGQRAASNVDVMGWLTALYAGKSYEHGTQPPLRFPRAVFAHRGDRVSLTLQKTFDAQALQPQLLLQPVCATYLQFSSRPGSTPQSPSKQPATALVALQLTAMPPAPLSCSGVFYDQYAGSRDGEGVPFGANIGTVAAPELWPVAIEFAQHGQSLVEGSRCAARPYTDARFNQIDLPPQWLSGLVSLDRNGCYDGSAWIREPQSSTGSFAVLVDQSSCLQGGWLQRGQWFAGNQRPGPDGLELLAGDRAQPRDDTCLVTLRGDVDAPNDGVVQLAARVVGTCPQRDNSWLGPSDNICYDLYNDVTGTTENGGWIETSNMGLYVPHGTTGDQLYEWIVSNGNCYMQPLIGTPFAYWTTIIGNGDPTPPPAPSPSPVPNPAGFGVDYVTRTAGLGNAPAPRPSEPPQRDCR